MKDDALPVPSGTELQGSLRMKISFSAKGPH